MLKYYQLKPRVGSGRPGFAACNDTELAYVIDDKGTQEITRLPKPEAALGRLRSKYAITELKDVDVSEAMKLVLDAELAPKGGDPLPPPPPPGGDDDSGRYDELLGSLLALEQRVAALEALAKGEAEKKADDANAGKPAGGE